MVGALTYLIITITMYGGMGGYTIGLSSVITKGINDKLTALHASTINRIIMQGGSGYALLGKVMIGGSGYGGGEEIKTDSITVNYSIGGGGFEIGYIPFSFKFLHPFAMLGIGGYGEEITLSKNEKRENWDSLWQNPAYEVTLSRGGFSLSPSLGLMFIFDSFPMGLMFKVTYNTILSKDWELRDGTKVSSAPASPMGGFSFTLTVFGGGFYRGK